MSSTVKEDRESEYKSKLHVHMPFLCLTLSSEQTHGAFFDHSAAVTRLHGQEVRHLSWNSVLTRPRHWTQFWTRSIILVLIVTRLLFSIKFKQ
jgi:hypothetical protein